MVLMDILDPTLQRTTGAAHYPWLTFVPSHINSTRMLRDIRLADFRNSAKNSRGLRVAPGVFSSAIRPFLMPTRSTMEVVPNFNSTLDLMVPMGNLFGTESLFHSNRARHFRISTTFALKFGYSMSILLSTQIDSLECECGIGKEAPEAPTTCHLQFQLSESPTECSCSLA